MSASSAPTHRHVRFVRTTIYKGVARQPDEVHSVPIYTASHLVRLGAAVYVERSQPRPLEDPASTVPVPTVPVPTHGPPAHAPTIEPGRKKRRRRR